MTVYRVGGGLMLGLGIVLLSLTTSIWIKIFAGTIFIIGFMVFGLDLMLRSIKKMP